MSQTQRRLYIVSNPNGLHMRPLQAFVETAGKYQSAVFLTKDGGERLNGKSLWNLLTMAAEQGTLVHLEVSGPDSLTATCPRRPNSPPRSTATCAIFPPPSGSPASTRSASPAKAGRRAAPTA